MIGLDESNILCDKYFARSIRLGRGRSNRVAFYRCRDGAFFQQNIDRIASPSSDGGDSVVETRPS